jgi:hypothetical protein
VEALSSITLETDDIHCVMGLLLYRTHHIQATRNSSHAQRGNFFPIIISNFDRFYKAVSINISNAGLAAALKMAEMAPAVVFWASWDVARHLQLVNSSRTCNLTHPGTLLTLHDCPTWAQAASKHQRHNLLCQVCQTCIQAYLLTYLQSL